MSDLKSISGIFCISVLGSVFRGVALWDFVQSKIQSTDGGDGHRARSFALVVFVYAEMIGS